MPRSNPAQPWQIEVFYDGACPLCMREIRFLQRLDKKNRIRPVDIAASDFRPADYGKTMEAFMGEIHGRLPDGTWVHGVEVFRKLYTAVGLRPLVWVTRLPIVAGLLDRAYRVFARNRLRWTGRCADKQGVCGVGSRASECAGSSRRAEDRMSAA